jgi:L-ascorbate 6-phosphate lactonase
MAIRLAQRIREITPDPGSLAVFWLGQAGYVYKTHTGTTVYIDPYLTDSVHRQLAHELYGFKRIMLTPIEPEEVEADFLICTHAHADHLDVDLVATLARDTRVNFIGAPDCDAEFTRLGVPSERRVIMRRGQRVDCGDLRVLPVYADHGELAPDALGIVLEVDGIKVWQVGDSAYRPDMWGDVFALGIDLLIPPINGAFGNLDAVAAARLAGDCRARLAVPCHFWMFAEHGGDPAAFLQACKAYAPETRPLLMSQGELLLVTAISG